MKYILLIFLAFIILSCDDNSIDTPPVDKVETELLGIWSGSIKQGTDSVYYMVNFADSEFGPVVKGEIYYKIAYTSGAGYSSSTQKGTVNYTYNKPNIVLRFYTDSDANGFIGVLSSDGKSMVGEVQPYDILTSKTYKYQITLTK